MRILSLVQRFDGSTVTRTRVEVKFARALPVLLESSYQLIRRI
nr:MAG TPA: hypothetical protein [Caudoviricetes sp.]